MATAKVTVKFKILEILENQLIVDSTTADKVGSTVVAEAKKMISQGLSPVRGEKRFEKYKNKEKYPGKKKPATPVNLELTGDMLKGYGYRRGKNNAVEIGMVSPTGNRDKVARYHNEGTPKMAARPITPQKGQEYAVSIMQAIRDIFDTRLSKMIRQSNIKK